MANESKSIVAQKGEVMPARQGDGDRSLRTSRERPAYAPKADILETADEFLVIADLPGVDEHSDFERRFVLSERIARDRIEASMN